MNVVKAVKELVAENEALKAEIDALKNTRCERCATEEKVKELLDECQALTAAATISHVWAKGESK